MTRFAKGLLLTALATLGACSQPAPKPAAAAPEPVKAAPAAPAAPAADKGDPDARFKAALKLMKDKQPKEAQEAFTALAADFPQYSGPFTDLGILAAQGKQRPAAIASFEKAVAANPDNAIAQNWLGSLYRENGEYARAEAAYRKAIAVRPDYAPAHLNLGLLYDVALKRPADALAQYREYQRLAGNDKLIVTAWIKELEAAQPAAAAAPAPAPATGGTRP